MTTLKLLPSAGLDHARRDDETFAAWTTRRHCVACAVLALAESSPEIPDSLEPVFHSFDDPMIRGPDRAIRLFACTACGRRWTFNADRSDWTLQA